MYFDVRYLSPTGALGKHNAVEAVSAAEAKILSPRMLCYGTEWDPSEFTVLSVTESTSPPQPSPKIQNVYTKRKGCCDACESEALA